MYTEEKTQFEIFSTNLKRILALKDISQSDAINAKWAPDGHPNDDENAETVEDTASDVVRTKGLEPK